MKMKLLSIFYWYGFSTQSSKTILKTSSLDSAKILSQEDSKFDDPVWKDAKYSLHFKCYSLAICVVNV